MKKIIDNSSPLQMILDLATYGYCLSPDWRSRVNNRTIRELLILFRTKQSRWEAFDYTRKCHIPMKITGLRLEHGILGVNVEDQFLRLYRLNHPSFRSGDYHPWREYELTLENPTYSWDESQDLLVLSGEMTEWVFRQNSNIYCLTVTIYIL